jgi:hypothetical protein
VEEIADAAGIAVERVRWFEGPVLAERAYAADQAQLASVRRQGDGIPSSPGPRLGEIVTERLKALGTDPEDAQWDARKLGDGNWQVHLTFTSGGRLHTAEWNFDPRRRHVVPADDNATRMSLPGGEPLQPAAPAPGEATVTHLAPRLSTAAAVHGNGAMAGSAAGNGLGSAGRAWQERPAPLRPAAPEPWISEPRVSEPRVSEPRVSEPQAPEPRETEAPAAAAPAVSSAPPVPSAPPTPSAPPVSPATVAAQVARAVPAAPPERHSQAPSSPHPAWHARPAQEPLTSEPRRETAAPSAAGHEAPAPPAAPAAETRAAETRAAETWPAETRAAETPTPEAPAPAPAAEAANEQVTRQGRKSARGKRSSVPSWDEIMFGNSRQRDLSVTARTAAGNGD